MSAAANSSLALARSLPPNPAPAAAAADHPHRHSAAPEANTHAHDDPPAVDSLSPDLLQRLAGFFSGLGDPNRLRIIDFLSRREACVCDIAEALDMRQSTVSHQLRALRHLRLVRSRRDGRHIHYRLHDHHVLQLHRIALDHLLEIHP